MSSGFWRQRGGSGMTAEKVDPGLSRNGKMTTRVKLKSLAGAVKFYE